MNSSRAVPGRADLARRLDAFAPLRLTGGPSPLHPLAKLGGQLGLDTLLIKRDDLQPLGGGGNKLRKLEYLVSAALAGRADTLVTGGALQSNHARLTAAVAARLGLGCELLLVDRVPRKEQAYRRGGNRSLNELFGARSTVLAPGADLPAILEAQCQSLRARGLRPFLIPFGGSSALGALGYADMVLELAGQLPAPERPATIVCACGSGGMLAGILAGVAAAGLDWRVLGISVLAERADIEATVAKIATEALDALGLAGTSLPEWAVLDAWVGRGYGIPGADTRAALLRVGTAEGVALDPVYTGKAMAGLLALAGAMPAPVRAAPVIFVHSGGLPGLFAYPELFRAAWPKATRRRPLRRNTR